MAIKPLQAFAHVAFAGVAAYAIAACGSNEEEGKERQDETGTGGMSGPAGSGGSSSGGSTSSNPGGNFGSGGAVNPPRPAQCGERSCGTVPLDTLGLEVGACCPQGSSASLCGLDLSLLSLVGVELSEPCQAVAQPGNESEECVDATVDVSGTVVTFAGCCRPEGKCGVLANILDVTEAQIELGLGCIVPDVFPAELLMPGSCTPRQGGADSDGGTSDAGFDSGAGPPTDAG
jgi:hypothetical protein